MVRLAGRVAEAGGAGGLIEAFKDQLREQTLGFNRSKPIGVGGNGVVYPSDIPGNVMKQNHCGGAGNDLVEEANLQAALTAGFELYGGKGRGRVPIGGLPPIPLPLDT